MQNTLLRTVDGPSYEPSTTYFSIAQSFLFIVLSADGEDHTPRSSLGLGRYPNELLVR